MFIQSLQRHIQDNLVHIIFQNIKYSNVRNKLWLSLNLLPLIRTEDAAYYLHMTHDIIASVSAPMNKQKLSPSRRVEDSIFF